MTKLSKSSPVPSEPRYLHRPVWPVLLPCPFCGLNPATATRTHGGISYYAISCNTPDCRGSSGNLGPDLEREVKRWNGRDLVVLKEIKLTALTMTSAKIGLGRILRLCIDAGVTETLDQLLPNAKLRDAAPTQPQTPQTHE